jgi:nucleoside-triphosphatase THEP1
MSPFVFHEEAFAAALDFLRAPLNGSRPSVVAIDEIGPLELENGRGFLPYINEWCRKGTEALVLTVRPQALGGLGALVGISPRVVELDQSRRPEAVSRIVDFIVGLGAELRDRRPPEYDRSNA